MADVQIRTTGDSSSATASLKSVSEHFEEVAKKADGLGEIVGTKLAQSFATAEAAVQLAEKAFEALKEVVSESISLGLEEEASIAKLAVTLQSTNKVVGEDAVEAFKGLSEQLERQTGVGREVSLSVEQMLLRLGVAADKIPEMTQMTLDLSAAMGIDATTAARMLGDAIETGHAGRLKMLLPLLDEQKLKLEPIKALEEAMANNRGAAAAAMETEAGQLKQLNLLWDEAKRALGGLVLEQEKERASWIEEHTGLDTSVRGWVEAIQYWEKAFGLVEEAPAKFDHLTKSIDAQAKELEDYDKAANAAFGFDEGTLAKIQTNLQRVAKMHAAAAKQAHDAWVLAFRQQSAQQQVEASLESTFDAAFKEQQAREMEKQREANAERKKEYDEQLKQTDEFLKKQIQAQEEAAKAEERIREDEARKAEQEAKKYEEIGIHVGESLVRGFEQSFKKDKGGGMSFDPKELIKSILPALVDVGVTAAFGPAAGPFLPLINEGMSAAFNIAGFAKGGWVDPMGVRHYDSGGWSSTDTVPAMLTPGERVLSLAEVSNMGGPGAVDSAAGGGGGSVTVAVGTLDSQSFQEFLGGRGGTGATRSLRYGAGELAQVLRRAGVVG